VKPFARPYWRECSRSSVRHELLQTWDAACLADGIGLPTASEHQYVSPGPPREGDREIQNLAQKGSLPFSGVLPQHDRMLYRAAIRHFPMSWLGPSRPPDWISQISHTPDQTGQKRPFSTKSGGVQREGCRWNGGHGGGGKNSTLRERTASIFRRTGTHACVCRRYRRPAASLADTARVVIIAPRDDSQRWSMLPGAPGKYKDPMRPTHEKSWGVHWRTGTGRVILSDMTIIGVKPLVVCRHCNARSRDHCEAFAAAAPHSTTEAPVARIQTPVPSVRKRLRGGGEARRRIKRQRSRSRNKFWQRTGGVADRWPLRRARQNLRETVFAGG